MAKMGMWMEDLLIGPKRSAKVLFSSPGTSTLIKMKACHGVAKLSLTHPMATSFISIHETKETTPTLRPRRDDVVSLVDPTVVGHFSTFM